MRLAREALKEGSIPTHLNVVGDGVEALAFLRGEGAYASAPRPDLVILDLNLPRKAGLEVLAEMKADESLRRIPVVVLTTSDVPQDIFKAYDLQASCYVRKPADLDAFLNVVKSVQDFCLTVVTLPPRV